MTEPFSNRELEHKFNDVHEKLDVIVEQVKRTNGRTSTLENWRWFVLGIVAVIMILIPVIYSMNISRIEEVEASTGAMQEQIANINGKLDGILTSLRANRNY